VNDDASWVTQSTTRVSGRQVFYQQAKKLLLNSPSCSQLDTNTGLVIDESIKLRRALAPDTIAFGIKVLNSLDLTISQPFRIRTPKRLGGLLVVFLFILQFVHCSSIVILLLMNKFLIPDLQDSGRGTWAQCHNGSCNGWFLPTVLFG